MPNQIEQLEEGKKLKVTLETGEIFEGDPLEVTNKMAAAHVETKRWGQTAHSELKTLKDKPPVTPPTTTPPVANPEEAQLQSYMLDVTGKALGYKNGDEYKADLIRVKAISDETQNRAVAAEFMNMCPDFPNTQPAIDALKKKMEDLGYNYSPQSMIAAHSVLVRENSSDPAKGYKPLSAAEQNATWANNMQAASRQQAPPMIRSGSPDANSQVPDLYKEPLDQMRARLIREQLAGGQ